MLFSHMFLKVSSLTCLFIYLYFFFVVNLSAFFHHCGIASLLHTSVKVNFLSPHTADIDFSHRINGKHAASPILTSLHSYFQRGWGWWITASGNTNRGGWGLGGEGAHK